MAKYVFVADPSLSREYNNFPLLDFLPCAPTKIVPEVVYSFLKGRRTPDDNGRAMFAPYALRTPIATIGHKPAPKSTMKIGYNTTSGTA